MIGRAVFCGLVGYFFAENAVHQPELPRAIASSVGMFVASISLNVPFSLYKYRELPSETVAATVRSTHGVLVAAWIAIGAAVVAMSGLPLTFGVMAALLLNFGICVWDLLSTMREMIDAVLMERPVGTSDVAMVRRLRSLAVLGDRAELLHEWMLQAVRARVNGENAPALPRDLEEHSDIIPDLIEELAGARS